MRTLLGLSLASAWLGWAAAPLAQEAPYHQSRKVMGTLCEVQLHHADGAAAARAMTAALDEMARVDRLLSNYLPDSELNRMNASAGKTPFQASPELYAFVKRSREYFDDTLGTFDPTMGAVVRAWGFFSPHPRRPSAADVRAARAKTGFDKVRLDDASRSVSYAVDGVEIDPGGIGKGYAVDRAVEVLRGLGITSALVSAGGSTLYAIGRPPGREGWKVAIRDPSRRTDALAVVALQDNAVSTSGVSERFVVQNGHRYAHIIDPRSGMPSEHMCQVTLIAPKAIASDALTKAAFLLSRQQLIDRLGARPGIHVLRVEDSCAGTVWTTPWSAGVFLR